MGQLRRRLLMPKRLCLAGCGRLTTASRCEVCSQPLRRLRRAERSIAAAVVASADVCAICGEPPTADDPLTLDHIVPVSRGGRAEPRNVQAAHRTCNSRKRDR